MCRSLRRKSLMSIDWTQVVTAEQLAETALSATKQRIAAARFIAETAGITASGRIVDTGRDSQGLITGAAFAASLDPAYVCRWKTPSGFVELDAPTLIATASAVRAHVQACFDREAELLDALADGTFTDSMLEEGWPGGSIPEPAAG
ncbi:DUF4376 domain-containing protein [Pseudomonas sp. PDM12]|nr:DUF4376 domain-containing protein [Pseudomonas sp. PDM12]